MADSYGELTGNQAWAQARHPKGEGNFMEDSNMQNAHCHDAYEIYFFLGEQMTYFLDKYSLKLRKYDLILVDRYVYHRTFYYKDYGSERINVIFNNEFLKLISDREAIEKLQALFKCPKLTLSDTGMKMKLCSLFQNLCDACAQENSISQLKGRFILCQILLTLLELSDHFTGPETSENTSVIEKRVSEIAAYIHANYSAPLALDFLARKFYMNKYYLCHTFKKVTGIGVTDFINIKRLTEAELLLKNSNLKITQICEKVGFNCQGHFIDLFKKHYGMSPKLFKKSLKKV